MKQSLKKNLTYQTLYQILITITPLITSPYLSRTLGAENLGIYSFTLSIVNYFTLFAMLGVSNYGCRTIAMAKDDNERTKLLSEIYTFQLLTSFICFALYMLVFLLLRIDNQIIFLAQVFWIVACLFNIDWFYFGIEEFKTTVNRNAFIKILSIIAIFAFVKNTKCLLIYTLIMSVSALLSQLVLFIKCKRKYDFRIAQWSDIKKHIKPNLILFIPLLAMSIYHIMDKTMLGLLSTHEQGGYYYNSDKIINIPIGIITGIGTVMLSRSSSLNSNKKDKEVIELLNVSLKAFLCIACAMCFGIAAISNEFVPFFFGKGYDPCILMIKVLSIVMIFKTISSILRTQYLIPYKKEKYFIISVFYGAFVNIIANIVFIKLLGLGGLGAIIGTLLSELVSCIIQIVYCQKYADIITPLKNTIVYLFSGALMYICVRAISSFIINIDTGLTINIIIEILFGGIIYVILCLLYWHIDKKNNLIKIVLKHKD